MKISCNWLRDYIDPEWTNAELADRLTMSGLEVESIEKFESVPGGLEGVVIGKVVEVRQHPNADRLKVCRVEIGEGSPVQIVCGAPNVAAGQTVPVATVGTTLKMNGEALTIKKAKIRGESSEGMICAEDELGIGESHEGIMVLEDKYPAGTPAKQVFELYEDDILEIGLTPNRVDAASHFGVARDVAALVRQKAEHPELSFEDQKDLQENPVSIDIEDVEKCPRYSGIYISGVTIAESPDWLKNRLRAIGLRPRNNIVDITNFVLHELGHPLHAFDADTLNGKKVVVKTPSGKMKFTTLDSIEREIDENDLMIWDGEQPVAIAGVMGGENSEVTDQTVNLFLESAYFNPSSVRKTAKKLGLKTDASFRFERGADPNVTVTALRRATDLILTLAGGKASHISDVVKSDFPPFRVELDMKRANALMGREFSVDEVTEILEALEIQVDGMKDDTLVLEVPRFRVDVTRQQDVLEEILRIYGYNNIGYTRRFSFAPGANAKHEVFKLKHRYLDYLAAAGFREIMTNSLVSDKYARTDSIRLLNPLSEDLAVLRTDLVRSGLEIIRYNLNRRQESLKLVESAKTYHGDGENRLEKEWIAFYVTGKTHEPHWDQKKKARNVDFYDLATEAYRMQQWFGFEGIVEEFGQEGFFDYGIRLKHEDEVVAEFGKLRDATTQEAEVEQPVLYGYADWLKLHELWTKRKIEFHPLPKFPATDRDVSMIVPEGLVYGEVADAIRIINPSLVKEVKIHDVYKGEAIGAGKKSYLLHLVLQEEEKTITDKVADKLMQQVFDLLEKNFGAEIRK